MCIRDRRWTAYIAPKPQSRLLCKFSFARWRALRTCGWTHTPQLHSCFQTVCHTMAIGDAMLNAHSLSAVADQLVFFAIDLDISSPWPWPWDPSPWPWYLKALALWPPSLALGAMTFVKLLTSLAPAMLSQADVVISDASMSLFRFRRNIAISVSYTHLTLPTKRIV